jgi:glucose-6-phosphate 1-dehydrogenase
MEPPADRSVDSVRDQKIKVIQSLRRLRGKAVVANVVRGQYGPGTIHGKNVVAYRDEDRVDPHSMTETFVAMKVNINNRRWAGTPFYIRAGKRLPIAGTEIAVQFRNAPGALFRPASNDGVPNVLVFRIQPNEGMSLQMQARIPGKSLRLETLTMDLHYGTTSDTAGPEAYERLLLDAITGDATLFARHDEIEHAWKFVDDIERAWHKSPQPPPLVPYAAGSWGPREADELIERDGRSWRVP